MPDEIHYHKMLYDTYSGMDLSKIAKEEISGNVYYYDKDSFSMTDEIRKKLSSFSKFDEPQFLEEIDGELVLS